MRRLMRAGVLTWVVAALVLAGEASGSILITRDARDATLRVDSQGFAEVAWTSANGGRRSVIVAPSGAVTYDHRLAGATSRAGGLAEIPFAVAYAGRLTARCGRCRSGAASPGARSSCASRGGAAIRRS